MKPPTWREGPSSCTSRRRPALLYEFNERVAEDFRANVADASASARDELRAFVERMGAELTAQAEILSAMLAEFFASPETLVAASAQETALSDLVIEIIERGQARGEFSRRIRPALAAASFLATSTLIISGQVFRDGTVSDAEIVEQLLQLTFSGLDPAADLDA